MLAGLDKGLRRIARMPPAAVAALLLAGLFLFLPALARLPATDRDEARFAQASRQMAETGDPVDIRFQAEPRHKKPAGIYWLQSASAAAFGTGPVWPYRLPSLIGALAAVLLTSGLARRLAGPEAALVAGLLLGASLVLGAEARLAKTDAVLAASVTGAFAALAALWQGAGGRSRALGFWASLAVAVLVKGPIGPLAVLTALAVLSFLRRGAGWLRPLAAPPGPLLFAALVLPWYVAITLRTGGSFWAEALGRDLMAKAGSGQEGHGAPPGSYLATLWLTFWPGAALLFPLLPDLWRRRREPAFTFALAWALPFWALFEAVPTKLLHYLLPVFPALALLAALAFLARAETLGRWPRRLSVGLAAVGPVLLAAVAGALAFGLGAGPAALWPAALALPVAALATAAYARALAADLRLAATGLLALAAAAVNAGLYHSLARTEALWPSAEAAAFLAALPCGPAAVVASGYAEPSLVFTLGTTGVTFADPAGAAAFLAGPGCRAALVADDTLPAFRAAAGALPLTEVGRVGGFALGAGRRVALTVFAPAPR